MGGAVGGVAASPCARGDTWPGEVGGAAAKLSMTKAPVGRQVEAGAAAGLGAVGGGWGGSRPGATGLQEPANVGAIFLFQPKGEL